MSRDLDELASRFFSWRQLFHAGETWQHLHRAGKAPDNVPLQQESWESYGELARLVLDPLRAVWANVQITYGFASPELTRCIEGRIYPALDQHAASELRHGRRVCERGGAAVDLVVPGTPSSLLVEWVARVLPFDRLYCYGDSRPFHVSYSSVRNRVIVDMLPGPSGRLIPKVRRGR